MSSYPIDVDSETVQFDGQWYTRDDLARRIRAMLDAGDFSVGRPSHALEELNRAIASLRTMAFRATQELAEGLSAAASRQGKTVGALVRDVLEAYLKVEGGQVEPPPRVAVDGAGVLPPPLPVTSKQAKAQEMPSVVVDASAVVPDGLESGSETHSGNGREDDAVERRWFGG